MADIEMEEFRRLVDAALARLGDSYRCGGPSEQAKLRAQTQQEIEHALLQEGRVWAALPSLAARQAAREEAERRRVRIWRQQAGAKSESAAKTPPSLSPPPAEPAPYKPAWMGPRGTYRTGPPLTEAGRALYRELDWEESGLADLEAELAEEITAPAVGPNEAPPIPAPKKTKSLSKADLGKALVDIQRARLDKGEDLLAREDALKLVRDEVGKNLFDWALGRAAWGDDEIVSSEFKPEAKRPRKRPL